MGMIKCDEIVRILLYIGLTCGIAGGLISAATSCSNDTSHLIGGLCKYNTISGVATIVSIGEPDPNEYNCANNPVKVIFDFAPEEPNAEESYSYPEWSDTGNSLTISDGANPPGSWVQDEGLIVGSEHPCLRKEIVSGTCTPVIFEFTDINYAEGIAKCW